MTDHCVDTPALLLGADAGEYLSRRESCAPLFYYGARRVILAFHVAKKESLNKNCEKKTATWAPDVDSVASLPDRVCSHSPEVPDRIVLDSRWKIHQMAGNLWLWAGSLCVLLSLIPLGSHAYRESDYINITEPAVCNKFTTGRNQSELQRRAYNCKLETPAEWCDAFEVNSICKNTLSTAESFIVLMTKFPLTIKYTISLPKATDERLYGSYRVNALASWGIVTGDVRTICDYDGYAYFALPEEGLGSGSVLPQHVSSKEWDMKTDVVLEGFFALDRHNSDAKAPVYAEGIIVTPVVCRVSPQKDGDNGVYPKRGYKYYALVVTEQSHSWGWLHPEMWAELVLLASIAVPKAVLVVWFAYRCRVFKDHVMQQQTYFLRVAVLNFLATIILMFFLIGANGTGIDTCCPTPFFAGLLWGIKVMTGFLFDLLVLATAKGWGVVIHRLDENETRKIMAYFFFSLVVYTMSRLMQPSFSLAWLVIVSETFIWIWIFFCLKHTKRELEFSSRIDRHAKLDMYTKLRRLLLSGLALWLIIVTVEVWAVLIVFNRENRVIIYDIPPTLAWDISLLLMMAGFGWIWQPSPATAQFSYAFSRQEEEGIDVRDAVSEFGIEAT